MQLSSLERGFAPLSEVQLVMPEHPTSGAVSEMGEDTSTHFRGAVSELSGGI